MIKGLEALEEIKTCRLIKRMKYKEGLFSNKLIEYEMTYGKDAFYRQIPIIEKELKEYEQIKQLKLLPYPQENSEEYRQIVIKRLMALEIIKEKQVDIPSLLGSNNFINYNRYKYDERKLNAEEYDFLKEVLK